MILVSDLETCLRYGRQDLYTDPIKCLRLLIEIISVRKELGSLVGGILEYHPEVSSMSLQYVSSATESDDLNMADGSDSFSMFTEAAEVPVHSAHQTHYKEHVF